MLGEVGDGNRSDIRNAVEAARAAGKWAEQSAHNRAQILYYIAENLSARAAEFARRLASGHGYSLPAASAEVEATIERLFGYAAWADKYDAARAVHATPLRNVTLAMPEPIGVIGIARPDERPLLGVCRRAGRRHQHGQHSRAHSVGAQRRCRPTDLYCVFDTSDLPGGVVNIVTGTRDPIGQGAGRA